MENIELEDIGKSSISPSHKKIALYGGIFAVALFLILAFYNYARSFTRLDNAQLATEQQLSELNIILNQNYPEQRYGGVKKLPFAVKPAQLDVWSKSAILIDASNGCVIYEKNADDLIPPASMTKLFVMYVALDELKKGNLHLDDVIPLPERSWAKNLPWDASRMGLGQGHIVTLKELLLGLSITSGNDAAIAIASCISGTTEKFVERMNEECLKLGLKQTHFVEPSGYSELNITTAREMASFCRMYIDIFPEGLKMFHSVESFSYPQRHNLPDWPEYKNILPYIKPNTNTLLKKLEGCDGIKTGFIEESGYNIALTCIRNNQRFISVTLKGPGNSTSEGNKTREHDGNLLMEWAFSSFADFVPKDYIKQEYPIAVPGSSDGKYCYLVPAWQNAISIPFVSGSTPQECASLVTAKVVTPKYIFGGVVQGQQYGYIEYSLLNNPLETVPLVADRQMQKSSLFGSLLDKLAVWFL